VTGCSRQLSSGGDGGGTGGGSPTTGVAVFGPYVDRYQGLRSSGGTVHHDGLCSLGLAQSFSARFPMTRYAYLARPLGFHAAWEPRRQRPRDSPTPKRRRCCIRIIRPRCGVDRPCAAVETTDDLPTAAALMIMYLLYLDAQAATPRGQSHPAGIRDLHHRDWSTLARPWLAREPD